VAQLPFFAVVGGLGVVWAFAFSTGWPNDPAATKLRHARQIRM
jgi:hypothetical protein